MGRDIQINTVEEQVYQIILNDIRTLKLLPGSRVNENQISEDLHVSRSPVRDAIKRLKGDKIIITIPNKGAFVRKLTTAELTEMYEVRLMIEGYALDSGSLPAEEETRSFLDLLGREEMAFKDRDLDEYRTVDFSLHKSIVSLCHNGYLNGIYENLSWQLYFLSLENEWDLLHFQRVHNDHLKIIHNLIDGNRDVSKKLLTSHIGRAREIIISRSKQESDSPYGAHCNL